MYVHVHICFEHTNLEKYEEMLENIKKVGSSNLRKYFMTAIMYNLLKLFTLVTTFY